MRALIFLVAVMLLAGGTTSAQPPSALNYQGLLTDGSGNPVADGSYNVRFTIWDDSTGGSQHFAQIVAVQTANGLFSAELDDPFGFLFQAGSTPPSGPFYLQLEITPDPPLTPRTRISSSFGAMVSRRLTGDAYSSPGNLLVLPDGVSPPGSLSPRLSIAVDDTDGASIAAFDDAGQVMGVEPQPFSDGYQIRLINSTSGNDLLTLSGSPTDGASIAAFDDAGQVMGIDPNPFVDGYQFRLINSTTGSDLLTFSGSPTDGASIAAFDDAGQVMGIEPTPFNDGYGLKFMNSTSGSDLLTLSGSPTNGASIAAFDDAGQVMGISPQPFNEGHVLNLFNPSTGATLVSLSSDYAAGTSRGELGLFDPLADLTSQLSPGLMALRYDDGGGAASEALVEVGASETSLTLLGPGSQGGDGTIVMLADNTTAQIGINTDAPTSALYVEGDIVATGAITELSDGRLKTNVTEISEASQILAQLRGVEYEWRHDNPDMPNLPDGRRFGLIAQEVEQVLPEAVVSPDDGFKSVDYARLTPILVEAVKEQQAQISAQQQQIDELKALVKQLTDDRTN